MTLRRGSVLVVDDEPTIGEVVARYLDRAGYRARVAVDGAEALALAAASPPDLVVLDLMLPGMDGLEVMRRLREQDRPAGERPPAIILLTARGEEADRIRGLRLGADDYVVKPFSPRELVARVEAVLRRGAPEAAGGSALEAGDIRIESAGRRVIVRGQEVVLTQREYDLLHFLARHPRQVFTREQLMDRVWESAFDADTTTVTVHVRRLRAKVEADPSAPAHVQTVWGVGYRFMP